MKVAIILALIAIPSISLADDAPTATELRVVGAQTFGELQEEISREDRQRLNGFGFSRMMGTGDGTINSTPQGYPVGQAGFPGSGLNPYGYGGMGLSPLSPTEPAETDE